ncbi:hypothetical protein [Qipengyuania sphaerica]|uniref:hypothetical protein n=1 Tax=Qipengyuania sphaerica TaxID=2867243 RepID=UPI001C87604E|nr:hypothetical protein [Qipengyuania sphaerica]MBX7541672.1 hypothetical protein [Qipengyuania sphaerica]
MGKGLNSKGKGRFAPAVLAVAGLALVIPGAGLAVGSPETAAASADLDFLPFTPAGADPELAQKVAALVGTDALRFTPASKPAPARDRTVNFAVRVDAATAKTLTGRRDLEADVKASPVEAGLPVAPTRYNLGIARGYQSFAQPTRSVTSAAVAEELRDFAMPDLGKFDGKEDDGKPSRFQSRIALEQKGNAGSAPLTLEGAGTQRVDLGGSYRLGRNLDVTAGVRIKQDRDRLSPLTDGMEDDQAVYVGTQIRF